MKTIPNTIQTLGVFVALFSLSMSVSCRGQNESESKVQTAEGKMTEPDTADRIAVRALPDSVKMPAGDFSWPRLLGVDFDGKGDVGEVRFDWTKRPEIVWELVVGEGYGLGSIAKGRYYHFDAIESDGISVERLRAIDLQTAQVLWAVSEPLNYGDLYGYESGPRGTPTIQGDHIYSVGVGGQLCCRSLADGELVWKVETNIDYGVVQNFFGVGSSPLVTDDLVVVQVGGSPPEDQQIAPGRLDRVIADGSAVVAFDRMTGNERWRAGNDLASYSSPRLMQLDGRNVVLQFARDHLLAMDLSDGNVLWKFKHRAEIIESVNGMIPVVNEQTIFISECYQVGSVLLNATRQGVTPVWQDPARNRRAQSMRCHWSTPALIDGFLYGCSGRNNPDSDFRCVELATGDVQWVDDRRVRSSVTKVADKLLVWDEDARLQIIVPNPGKLTVLGEYNFDSLVSPPCWAAPVVVGNRILIRGDKKVVCLAAHQNVNVE